MTRLVKTAGVYGVGFTAGSLARKGAKGGTGNKISSDKELMEVGRIAEGDRGGRGGGREESCEWRDQIRGCDDIFFEDMPQRMKTRVVGED